MEARLGSFFATPSISFATAEVKWISQCSFIVSAARV